MYRNFLMTVALEIGSREIIVEERSARFFGPSLA